MDHNILQWNYNGFYNHFNEIKLLISDLNPFALSIQETHFNQYRKPTLKNYKIYYKIDEYHQRASGGVAICVNVNHHSKKINLDTNLQAIAVKLFYPIEFTLCNVYLPPNQNVSKMTLKA